MLDRVMPTGWGGPDPHLRYLTEFASGIEIPSWVCGPNGGIGKVLGKVIEFGAEVGPDVFPDGKSLLQSGIPITVERQKNGVSAEVAECSSLRPQGTGGKDCNRQDRNESHVTSSTQS
jgi:hypothetical protein